MQLRDQEQERRHQTRKRQRRLLQVALFASGVLVLGAVVGKVREADQRPLLVERTPIQALIDQPISSNSSQADQATALLPHSQSDPSTPSPTLAATPALSAGEPAQTAELQRQAEPVERVDEVTVAAGDNLALIFQRLEIPAGEMLRIVNSGELGEQLSRLRVGQTLTVTRAGDGRLLRVQTEINPETRLIVTRQENGFLIDREAIALERRTLFSKVEIDAGSSLYLSAHEAGVPDAVINSIAEAYGWKLDFGRDIQPRDEFRVLFNALYRDDVLVRIEQVLAAELVNRGKAMPIIGFATPQGKPQFYTPDGKSMDRGFLRYPVEFTRISSHFSAARMHPILHTVRAHKGTDFAAPSGTPVMAASDGVVQYRGWKNGYGNVVILQHDGKYSTVYGHLSRFGAAKQGERVERGKVIGYVGMTGHATGPHLHYEFRINGEHQDPLKVTLPENRSIAPDQRLAFMEHSQRWLAELRLQQTEGTLARVDSGADGVGHPDGVN